jgi:hypothetical protein
MDLAINSIIASPLYKALRQNGDGKKAPVEFEYNLGVSPIPFAKHVHSQKCDIAINSANISQKIQFSVPQYGLGSIFYLKVSCTATANSTAYPSGVMGIIKDKVKLHAGNIMLEELHVDAIMNHFSKLPEAERIAITQAIGAGALINTSANVFYIPLYFSFSMRPENFIDLAFIEPLTVSFTTNSGSGIAPNCVLSSLEISLQIITSIPEAKSYYELKQKQFSISEPLAMLWKNEYREQPITVVASGTTVSFPDVLLKCNKLCRSTIVQCYLQGSPAAYYPLVKLELLSMNETLYEADHYEMSVMAKRPWNQFLHSLNTGVDYCYEINYDLNGNFISCDGALGFKNLNTPTLTCSFSGVTSGSTYVLSIIHNYWNVINISGTDGSIIRSLDV